MEDKKVTIDISTKSIFKFFIGFVLILFLYFIRDILAIFLISLIIVTALSPVVNKLHAFKIPKSITVLTIYTLFFGFIGFLIFSIVPQLAGQINDIAKDVPGTIKQFNQVFGQIPQHESIAKGAQETLKNLGNNIGGSTANILSSLFRVFGGIVTFVVILVLTLYMSVAEGEIKKFFQSIFPKRHEKKVERTIERVQEKIGLWVRGEFILMFSVGLFTYVGLLVLGVKFALTLAIIAGLLEIIPYVGPIISGVPAVIIAFTQAPVLGLFALILYVLVHEFEGHILVPKVMEKTTGISPVVIILSLLIGAKLMGFLGVFLAVPVAVILSVFVEDIVERQAEN